MEHTEDIIIQLAGIAARIREGLPVSPDEQSLLNDWLAASPANGELLGRLHNHAWLGAQLRKMDTVDTDSAFIRISTELGIARQPRRIWRYAAAAAVIGIAGFLLLRNYRDSASPKGNMAASAQPVAPGQSGRATLTLANGATMTLDTARNGLLANQGGAAVTKSDGMIDYQDAADETPVIHRLSTPKGGQFQLRLPDGSRVWLNSASSLIFPTAFTGPERQVELSGEAYFEIEKDDAHPFRVLTKRTAVEVLGTHFNLNAYPDEQRELTTLAEGKVRVVAEGADVVLRPGQQAVFDATNGRMNRLPADVRKVTAWKNGMFEFNDADLPTVLREVARWYDVEIIYQTNSLEGRYGGGIGRDQPLKEVLRMLEETGQNGFRTEGRKVYVLSTSQP